MDYGKYKNARNASWYCLIDYYVTELPVKVSKIANKADISLIKNSEVNLLNEKSSGFSFIQDNKFYIIYRDTEPPRRCRFTIAHELGHIFLGHLLIDNKQFRTFDTNNDTESAANVFARDLLAPACVLHELHAINATDIANICDISLEAAEYRTKRIRELESRNAWYLHPLERKVKQQFDDFIKRKKAE